MCLTSKLLTSGWCAAWRRKPESTDIFSEKEPFCVIPNPKDTWVADPFAFEYQNELYIFGELFDLATGKGSIAYCMPQKKDCRWIKIIDEPYHMSYPFLFTKGSDIYIMPETEKEHAIRLFKAKHFPELWEKQPPLRNGVDYVDVTPFLQEAPQKALAYHVNTERIENSELWLIDLEHPELDQRIPVNHNEIRRPAGRMDEIQKIRPAQDSAQDYGDGLVFFRYETNFTNQYSETEIKRVYPNDICFTTRTRCNGLHTYNQSEHYECIDLRIRKLMIRNMFRKIKHHLLSR